ncbi:hypothetical protein ABMA27_014958 [Loxostege sticticalis]|uniref:Uncharacterized protein n=1 Tax=Loxostege sticticalis TaxID=481309 RepID=A0ABR3IAT1_LOXSC
MCILVIYFSDTVYSSSALDDFFNNLSERVSDFWSSIGKTWDKMVTNIKKPVKLRRLGSIGKRKRTKTTSTTPYAPIDVEEKDSEELSDNTPSYDDAESTELPPDSDEIAFTMYAYQVTVPEEGKVKVPYIPGPIWKTVGDWKRMQMPRFVKIGSDDGDFEAATIETENTLADNVPETERFGVLMFI